MGPEIETTARSEEPAGANAHGCCPHGPLAPDPGSREMRGFDWILSGPHGLRAGWSLAIFVVLFRLFSAILSTIVVGLYPAVTQPGFSPATALASESVPFLSMLGAVAMVGLFELRSIAEFNLTGPRRPVNFFFGAAAGFLALSALVAALALGGWLHFGPVALAGATVVRFGVLWGCAFLLVGCVEEGIFRCFLQFTLTRSINFWWALGIVGVLCADLLLRSRGHMGLIAFVWMTPLAAVTGNGLWGVFAVALAGLVPCFVLYLKSASQSGFWQAAWVTSTLFGFIHTANNGENWIGIFAAAAIGFVFCVSVWVTGSAWWAIGCHAGWDWAETYFYGTADSGLPAQGHYLTTSPAGNLFWSGGADGPEGSVLVLGVILLLLVALLVIYGRKRETAKVAAMELRQAEG